MRRRALSLVLLVALSSGCALPWQDEADEAPWPPTRPTPATPPPAGPPLVFGGIVLDAATGDPLPDAEVRLDLMFTRPCQRPGIGYASWEIPVEGDGTWGPQEVARPRSDDVAFFLHASAPGHSENLTYIGPAEARAGIDSMSVLLHPDAAIEGSAPPGTVLALDAPKFPRLSVADANGTFRFEHARAVEAQLVAATDVPQRFVVAAPAQLAVNATAPEGWLLQGVTRHESGAPIAADVVAWNGTQLWSAGRSGENGVFTLPLPAEAVKLRVEARTEDGAYGGVLSLDITGPPALRQSVLMRPLC